MSLLLRHATLIDPAKGTRQVGDLLIREGRIVQAGASLSPGGARVLEADGLIAAPGLIDAHVHLRDPGQTYKEDLRSGTAAAAAGGFTTVVAMPNTLPAMDNAGLLSDLQARARVQGLVRVRQVGAISRGLAGEALSDFEALAQAGAVAFSDDGRPVENGELMRLALERAAALGKPVLSHAEELTLPSGLAASESCAVARDICLAEQTGCPVHLCHISTAASVRLIRDAKRAGIPVTAETAPHYFTLSREDEGCAGNPNAKMNPPLRTPRDRLAVREALADGTIDLIATDHAPHADFEKSLPFEKAPNGIVGLETALALGITELVRGGVLTLPMLLSKLSTVPARLFGLEGGSLEPGQPADLVLFDENGRPRRAAREVPQHALWRAPPLRARQADAAGGRRGLPGALSRRAAAVPSPFPEGRNLAGSDFERFFCMINFCMIKGGPHVCRFAHRAHCHPAKPHRGGA